MSSQWSLSTQPDDQGTKYQTLQRGIRWFHNKDCFLVNFLLQHWWSCHLGQPGGEKKENIEDSEQKCVWLTYIVEKGEHCQPVWFISGFSEALVLVRVVMDNMELENKVEIQVRCQIQMEERQIIRHYRTLSGKYSEKKKKKRRASVKYIYM